MEVNFAHTAHTANTAHTAHTAHTAVTAHTDNTGNTAHTAHTANTSSTTNTANTVNFRIIFLYNFPPFSAIYSFKTYLLIFCKSSLVFYVLFFTSKKLKGSWHLSHLLVKLSNP